MLSNVMIDLHKVMHWLNTRKMTVEMLGCAAVTTGINAKTPPDDGPVSLPLEEGIRISKLLNVSLQQLQTQEKRKVIYRSASEMLATRRPIFRDGIHFYNYYNLPSPTGAVAPVILDILCPSDRVPRLNNGHLEPAITVNLGPGPINGRWADELTEHSWQRLEAHRDSWIVGESYVEAPYCPHAYSLASPVPARIVSYTARAELQGFFDETTLWTDDAWHEAQRTIGADHADWLQALMARRGLHVESLAEICGLSANSLSAYVHGDRNALSLAEVVKVADALGQDYRPLLYPAQNGDALGKKSLSLAESERSRRVYKGYEIASMASATSLPDICGLFMRLRGETPGGQLVECGPTHYLVTRGQLTIFWIEGGAERVQRLGVDDSLWVPPFTRHWFSGDGALLKLGNGEGLGYLDAIAMSNLFDRGGTLSRARADLAVWGYDQ